MRLRNFALWLEVCFWGVSTYGAAGGRAYEWIMVGPHKGSYKKLLENDSCIIGCEFNTGPDSMY